MTTKTTLFIAASILFAHVAMAHAQVRTFVEPTGGPLTSLPDATCNATTAVIVPADSGQEAAILTNVGSNPARIGDANCGASQCAQLAAGATLLINTTGAISCYSAGGTTIAITKVEQ